MLSFRYFMRIRPVLLFLAEEYPQESEQQQSEQREGGAHQDCFSSCQYTCGIIILLVSGNEA